jgi:hypothetical protein
MIDDRQCTKTDSDCIGSRSLLSISMWHYHLTNMKFIPANQLIVTSRNSFFRFNRYLQLNLYLTPTAATLCAAFQTIFPLSDLIH